MAGLLQLLKVVDASVVDVAGSVGHEHARRNLIGARKVRNDLTIEGGRQYLAVAHTHAKLHRLRSFLLRLGLNNLSNSCLGLCSVAVGVRMYSLPNGSQVIKGLLKMSWRSLISGTTWDSHEFFSSEFFEEWSVVCRFD
jgi:hypothetical protein